ncbi:hypothetical protein N9A45_00385 [bacterium]|nr:hypothetical protein [bacterium]
MGSRLLQYLCQAIEQRMSVSRFNQYVQKSVEQIAQDFVRSFDHTCRVWLNDPNMSDDDILEYQNSQHWVMMIGQYYGKLINIATEGVGRQLVATPGNAKIWNQWLEKVNALVSDDRFKQTKTRIENARLMKSYKRTKISAYLGTDDEGAIKVFKDKQKNVPIYGTKNKRSLT